MEDYQRRVVIEYADLAEKRTKLNAFLGSEASASVMFADRRLLERQIDAMDNYAAILSERLTAFEIHIGAAMREIDATTTPEDAIGLIRELSDKNTDEMYRAAVTEILSFVK